MAKPITIKALDRQYFDDACSNEPVYGKMSHYIGEGEYKTLYIYALLGKQVSYTPTHDNLSCKKFTKCTVEVYTDLESMDKGLPPQAIEYNATVIFCY